MKSRYLRFSFFLRRRIAELQKRGCYEGSVGYQNTSLTTMDRMSCLSFLILCLTSVANGNKANKHKPWIETEYQGIVMENDNTVLLNPPLFALDKDAPLHYAEEELFEVV
nr:calsyntenin-3-like [Oncorhynchus nerka]